MMMEYLLSVRYSLVNFVDNIFWLWLEMSVWFILSLVIFVIILFILKLVLSSFAKKVLWIKQKLIYEYDNIFYLLSLSQYEQELDKKSLGGDPCIAAIKPILNMKNPTYISNRIIIKSNIKKVEILLWKQVISDDIWNQINKFHKKLKSTSLIHKIVKILLMLILFVMVVVFVYMFSV